MAIALIASIATDDASANDVHALIDTIESLQQSLEDFRCEFEGTNHVKSKVAESFQVTREDGLRETFSGFFVWKRGGDIRAETMHRRASDNQISREGFAIRTREQLAEEYNRLNDAALGYGAVRKPKDVYFWQSGSFGEIFLIEKIKQDAMDPDLEPFVSDDQIDGKPLKVLNVAMRNVPDSLLWRYWIDLRRSGQVVRMESYFPGKVISRRIDIKLEPFKIGDTELWLPVNGDAVGYGEIVDKRPVVTKSPTTFETIYLVAGTMELNKRPGRDVFTVRYKPGTPISDSLRKLEYEFGQQKLGPKPSKAKVQKMLDEQVAKAREQGNELVAASTTQEADWTIWFSGGFGIAVVISSLALWAQGRRR